MEKANYRAHSQASQPNIPHGNRDAALARGRLPSRRSHSWCGPSSHATQLAIVNPGQHEMPWQGEGSDNRRGKQLQVDNVPHMLQVHNTATGGRRQQYQQQRRRKQYLNREDDLGQQEREKDLVDQAPCSFNSCRGKGGQHRSSVHRPPCEQPRETNWQGDNWGRCQQQCTEPPDQVQAGGEEEVMFWNLKKHCWVKTLHVSRGIQQKASKCLRPMNVAGFCLPGMCTPHNTSQYIMEQHEDTWRNKEEAATALSGGSSNYSTADDDFYFPPMALEIDDTSTEEEEEESSQPACQD